MEERKGGRKKSRKMKKGEERKGRIEEMREDGKKKGVIDFELEWTNLDNISIHFRAGTQLMLAWNIYHCSTRQ